MPPPTQQSRPFFSNFLAAFRSSQLSSTPIISNGTSSHPKPAHTHTHSHSQSTPSQPRQINPSTKSNAPSTTLRGIDRNRASNPGSSPMGSYDSSPSPHASSFLNPNQSQNQNQHQPQSSTHPQNSHSNSNPNSNPSSPPNAHPSQNRYGVNGGFKTAADRRGSDSSSEGFRDVMGMEKWYIGGRTQMGEERYFQLGVVRRRRSGGEMSLDRLSL